MPRALLSVSDKTGIVDLGRGLVGRGFELVSTGGTARALAGAGLAVTNVSALTGFPEMMDGRVKTLHPALHGGILARRDRPDDLAALERHGLGLVDVVVVNLYPFVAAAANPDTRFDALVEEIDIGGPSLVRAAAKNFRGVLVVVDPADYPRLLAAIDATPTLAFRFELMRKAIGHTAAYDTAISATLATVDLHGDRFDRRTPDASASIGDRVDLTLEKIRDLRYGENPHQRAAWYRPAPSPVTRGIAPVGGLGAASVLQGKELSYTNLLDLDAAARIVLEFDEPAAVVIKHTNPCGAATGESPADAYVRAREADSLAAFGGIVALNRPIDVATAEAIVSTFIEAVLAPSVDEAATAAPRAEGEHAGRHRRLRGARTRRRISIDPGRDARAGAGCGGGGPAALERDVVTRRPEGRDQAPAHAGRMGGAALRVASVRAREVEHGDLHRRSQDAGYRGRSDEPSGRGECRGHEGTGCEPFAGRLGRGL